MAFRSIGQAVSQFNSASSCDFVDLYTEYLERIVREDAEEASSRTFAPSSMRCKRKSWFRIRGTEPDSAPRVDLGLKFTARLGTAIHRDIQYDLIDLLKDDWVPLSKYFEEAPPTYSYNLTISGPETLIEVDDPPVKFSVDGIVRINGTLYLLEIKTIEWNSWNNLQNPRDEHIAQVYTYCTMLGLRNVLFLYVDRQYGGLKCYEVNVPEYRIDEVKQSMSEVMRCVSANLPPEGLPKGDKWCTPSMCPYFNKCKEWS